MATTLQAETHPNQEGETLDVEWRAMIGTDGIRKDYDGSAFAPSLGSSTATISIASAGKDLVVDGNLLHFTGNATLSPREVGTLPTGSAARQDLVVARYDSAVELLRDRGTIAIKPGVPAVAGALPTIDRSELPDGRYEIPLCSYTLPVTGLLSNLVDRRGWSSGSPIVLADGGALTSTSRPIGTVAYWRGSTWFRTLAGGTPTWVEVPQQFAGIVESYSSAPVTGADTFVRNATPDLLATPITLPTRPYKRVASISASAIATNFNDDLVYADCGFRILRNGAVLSDRARRSRTSKRNSSAVASREFVLDADATYVVQWLGAAIGIASPAVEFSSSATYTYVDVTTRGIV